jgi:hypothetical protein
MGAASNWGGMRGLTTSEMADQDRSGGTAMPRWRSSLRNSTSPICRQVEQKNITTNIPPRTRSDRGIEPKIAVHRMPGVPDTDDTLGLVRGLGRDSVAGLLFEHVPGGVRWCLCADHE